MISLHISIGTYYVYSLILTYTWYTWVLMISIPAPLNVMLQNITGFWWVFHCVVGMYNIHTYYFGKTIVDSVWEKKIQHMWFFLYINRSFPLHPKYVTNLVPNYLNINSKSKISIYQQRFKPVITNLKNLQNYNCSLYIIYCICLEFSNSLRYIY